MNILLFNKRDIIFSLLVAIFLVSGPTVSYAVDSEEAAIKRTEEIKQKFKEKIGKEWDETGKREQEAYLDYLHKVELKEKEKKVTRKVAPNPKATLEVWRSFERESGKSWEEATDEEQSIFFKKFDKKKKRERRALIREQAQEKRNEKISQREKRNKKRAKLREEQAEERAIKLEHREKERKKREIRRWITLTKREFARKRQEMKRKRKR